MRYVHVSVDADVNPDEVFDSLTDNEKAELFSKHMPRTGVVVPLGAGEGDQSIVNRYIEQAHLAATQMADCPQAFKDLLWHVHGRAI